MSEVNKDIQRIESIYNEAVKLAEQGFVEPALISARKMTEGIVLTMVKMEGINPPPELTPSSNALQQIWKRHAEKKYDIGFIDAFLGQISIMLMLGNRAGHFSINNQVDIISTLDALKRLQAVFEYFKEYVTFYHRAQSRAKDLYIDNQNPQLPLCLKYISVKNYYSIKHLELKDIPTNAKFVVLTGDNGEGKTSVLQAIAIGVHGDYEDFTSLRFLAKKNLSVEVEVNASGSNIYNTYQSKDTSFGLMTKNDSVVAYGASRLQLQSEESQDNRNARQSNIYGIFKAENILLNIDYWFKMQYLNKDIKRIESVKKLLTKLMPSISEIIIGEPKGPKPVKSYGMGFPVKVNPNRFEIFYIEHGLEKKSDELSAGNKNILAMIGDMVIRLYENQPETINTEELYGIVLIDELETHLHPKWQKELPRLLAENFPWVQFIVTTHSPMVFLGMPKNSVFYNISRNENNETIAQRLDIDIENAMPHEILTSPLFGMENLRNVNNKGIEYLSLETTQEKNARLKEEAELKALAANFKFQIPKS